VLFSAQRVVKSHKLIQLGGCVDEMMRIFAPKEDIVRLSESRITCVECVILLGRGK
jgi:hypothetical protein